MAVVSISRIQVRRGQRKSGSGLPQLASGELGWAIDTRELFIGNGSVSEGAPAVGNTKILTEFDDIFSLAGSYEYREDESYIQTGPDSTRPVRRSLKERLDDRVSVRSFGAVGDGQANDTSALQRAIDQLYLSGPIKDEPQSRVVIHVEPGTYIIDDTIYLPPFVTLKGAGSDKTVIKQINNNVRTFRTVNQESSPGEPADDSLTTSQNQARNLYLEGMTVELESLDNAILLHSCKNSIFRDIKLLGNWTSVDTVDKANSALEFVNTSDVVPSNNNSFIECNFSNFSYAVISNWDIMNNIWDNCEFENLGIGFSFGEDPAPGQTSGPMFNIIKSSKFKDINQEGIKVDQGSMNISEFNKFVSVGNETGPEKSPVHPVIKFAEKSNKSVNDFFSRTSSLISGANLSNVPYIPEISGPSYYTLNFENEVTFGKLENVRVFRLPAVYNQVYELDYSLVSELYNSVRFGKMFVNVNAYSNEVEIFDEYSFTGNNTYQEAVNFNAVLRDLDGDTEPDTIIVRVKSDMPDDDQSQLKFTVNAKRSNLS